MDPQELRQGNIIYHAPFSTATEIVRIREIKEAELSHSEGTEGLIYNDSDEYKPVKITETIIQAAGGIKHKFGSGYQLGKLYMLELGTGKWGANILVNDFPINLCVLTYLHQLQNLNYSINGKELSFEI